MPEYEQSFSVNTGASPSLPFTHFTKSAWPILRLSSRSHQATQVDEFFELPWASLTTQTVKPKPFLAEIYNTIFSARDKLSFSSPSAD